MEQRGFSYPRTREGVPYRASVTVVDGEGRSSTYYDGGELSPYGTQSLIELLKARSKAPHRSLSLTLELRGPISQTALNDIESRVKALSRGDLRVRIVAPGKGVPAISDAEDLPNGRGH